MAEDAEATAHVVVDGPGHEGTCFPLREGITSFGRLPGNDLILLGDLVSRHHARIAYFEGRATLQDLGSHNGCYVGGERVTARLLEHGDVIRLGNFELRFLRGAPGEAPVEPPVQAIPDEGPGSLLDELRAARRGEPSPARALHFLYRATSALAGAARHADYGAEMLSLALEHTGTTYGAWVSELAGRLRLEAETGTPDPSGLPREALKWAIERGAPVQSGDLARDDRFGGQAGGGSALIVPFEADERRHALLVRGAAQPPTGDDLARLGVVAHLMTEGLATLAERAALPGPDSARAPAPVSALTVLQLELHGLSAAVGPAEGAPAAGLLERFHAETRARFEPTGAWIEALCGQRLMVVLGLQRPVGPEQLADALDGVASLRARIDAEVRRGPSPLHGVRLRAGIASGDGVLGSASGRPYLLGPAVAIAARLLEASVGGRLLVDAATLERARPRPTARRVGQQSARGRIAAQALYEFAPTGEESPRDSRLKRRR